VLELRVKVVGLYSISDEWQVKCMVHVVAWESTNSVTSPSKYATQMH
jgi:hypothetical protein